LHDDVIKKEKEEGNMTGGKTIRRNRNDV